jgi:putative endonuclease
MNNYRLGLFGEYFLMFLLTLRGYKVVARRYKTGLGEIDVIAERKKSLVIFEVKSSRSKVPTSEIVTPRQSGRIKRALDVFLSNNSEYASYDISYCVFFYKNVFNYRFYK